MSVISTTGGDIRRGDVLGDGRVVVGVRPKPDGMVAVAVKRPRSRQPTLLLLDPDAPVRVLRIPAQREKDTSKKNLQMS